MAGRFVDGLEQRAAELLPEEVHRYVRQGAREGASAAEAVAAWDRYRFLPQVMRAVTEVDTTTTLLGTAVSMPVAVAPTTLQRAAHPTGEVGMAQAVADAGSLLVVSSNAGSPFAEVSATGATWWLQLYVPSDRPAAIPLLDRAVAAGARAVVLTVDTPVVGTKYDGGASAWDTADPAWLHANLDGPAPQHGPGAGSGSDKARDLGPHDIDWLAQRTGLPVVVKGVLRPDDARRCVDAGAAAVWVSNHGGRQLDYAAATADQLAAVVAEVGPGAEVYVDGGVRNARHVVTALALGARGVFLGRLPLYALADGGAVGVRRLFADLVEELVETLVLLGCARAADVPAGVVRRLTCP
jgi:4-hydroxymandelate oxidase